MASYPNRIVCGMRLFLDACVAHNFAVGNNAGSSVRTASCMTIENTDAERNAVHGAICGLLSEAGIENPSAAFVLHRVTGEYASYILIAANGCHESLESIFRNNVAFKPSSVNGVWILLPQDAVQLVPYGP
jgi:hypothetical protein